MTRYLVAAILASTLTAWLLHRARRCAALAEDCWDTPNRTADGTNGDCWRDPYTDRLAAELGMTERCRR